MMCKGWVSIDLLSSNVRMDYLSILWIHFNQSFHFGQRCGNTPLVGVVESKTYTQCHTSLEALVRRVTEIIFPCYEFLCSNHSMRRNLELEATIVEKYTAVEAFLDERGRRIWAATESRAIGYGGDALVSDATGLSRPTIRSGRRELESGSVERGRIRRPGAGRPSIEQSQPGIKQALEKLVDPLTRGDPESPLRWTCKSRAKLTAALSKAGWKVSSTTVSRLLLRPA